MRFRTSTRFPLDLQLFSAEPRPKPWFLTPSPGSPLLGQRCEIQAQITTLEVDNGILSIVPLVERVT